MAIHQTKQQSDLEKRLKLLRQQVYGKQKWEMGSEKVENEVGNGNQNIPLQYPTSHLPHPTSSIRSDLTYLRHDLSKIAILASAAFAIQAILYYLLQNNILKINLF